MIMIDMYLYITSIHMLQEIHICVVAISWVYFTDIIESREIETCMSCSLTSCAGLPTAFGKAGSITEARHLSILCHCHCLSEPEKLNHVRRCSKQCDSV